MSDLVSRVLVAIEETERQARVAHPGPWAIHRDDGGTFVTYGDEGRIVGKVFAGYDARFIVRNDPAAVLRRCAADKRQVQRLAEMVRLGEEYYDNPTVWGLVQDSLRDFAVAYGISVEEETTQ